MVTTRRSKRLEAEKSDEVPEVTPEKPAQAEREEVTEGEAPNEVDSDAEEMREVFLLGVGEATTREEEKRPVSTPVTEPEQPAAAADPVEAEAPQTNDGEGDKNGGQGQEPAETLLVEDDRTPREATTPLDADKDDGEVELDPLVLPRHGSELFVGNIPNFTVDELKDIFVEFHPKEARIPMDLRTMERRKYGFVTLENPEQAAVAVEKLNGKVVKGNAIRVSRSQTKNRLFFGNLPRDLSNTEFEAVVGEHSVGAEEFEVVRDKDNGNCCGFGFVAFFNHACAEKAKRSLEQGKVTLAGAKPRIEFAESKKDDLPRGGGAGLPSGGGASSSSAGIRSVYVAGLDSRANEYSLRRMFEPFGSIERIALPSSSGRQSRFGFVHYREVSSAVRAVDAHERDPFVNTDSGSALTVELAKTPERRDHRDGSMRGRDSYNDRMRRQKRPRDQRMQDHYHGGIGAGGGRPSDPRLASAGSQNRYQHGGSSRSTRPRLDNASPPRGGGSYGDYGGGMVQMHPTHPMGSMPPQMQPPQMQPPQMQPQQMQPQQMQPQPQMGMNTMNMSGMAMVPMMLPNGQVGYMLQPQGGTPQQGNAGGSLFQQQEPGPY